MDISSISSALLSVNSSDPGSLANAVSIKMLDNAISSNESLGWCRAGKNDGELCLS